MKNKFRKWSAWICGIVGALCLGGAGMALSTATESSGVVASAEVTYTTYNVTARVEAGNAECIYIAEKGQNGDYWGDEDKDTWKYLYTFQPDSGVGLTLNGDILTTTDIKQPASFYIGLGVTAQAGDVFIIDGTYYNETTAKKFIFNNAAFRFNGTSWETCTAFSMGSMTAEGGDAATLNLTGAETLTAGASLEIVKGGIYVNGRDVAKERVSSIKTAENGGITFQANMDDMVADVVYINALLKTKYGADYYAIADSYFMWTGESWRTLTGYTAIVSKTETINAGDYLDRENGFTVQLDQNTGKVDWSQGMTLSSGNGLKLNGVPLTNGAIKIIGDKFYVDLGTNASAGDILTINGLYTYENVKILFAPTQALQYDGSKWTDVDFNNGGTTYDLDVLEVGAASSGGDATATGLYLKRKTDGYTPVNSKDDAFTKETGAGVKVNGEEVTVNLKSVGGNVYADFSGVTINAGDVVSIGGTFYCESQSTRYVIVEGYYKWNGTSWEAGEAYFKTEIDTVELSESDNGRNGFFVDLPKNVGITTWDYAFTKESGDGITLNGKAIDGVVIKPIGTQLYVDVHSVPTIHNGDILIIAGTFKCIANGVTAELVFNEQQILKWNGVHWVVDTVTTYNIGKLELHVNSSTGGASGLNSDLYLQRADGKDLPILSWDYLFAYESGDGFMINGVQKTPTTIKSTGDGFYWAFDGVSAGDVVSVSGVFWCESQNVRYIIQESYFDWNGSGWENDVVYTATYTIQNLQPTSPSTNVDALNTQVYLKINGSEGLPVQTWDHVFTLRKGDGLKVNGEAKPIYEMKSTNAGLWFSFEGAQKGDIVSLSGTFVCKTLQTKYIIEECTFTYNEEGKWVARISYTDDELEAYDTVSLSDFGLGLSTTVQGAAEPQHKIYSYTNSAENTTGSLKLRFTYNSADVDAGTFNIRLRVDNGGWGDDFNFRFIWGGVDLSGKTTIPLENNTDYLIELGAINVKNQNVIWAYIKIDGVLMETRNVESTQNSNRISFYVEQSVAATTLTDPDHVAVNYEGSDAQYVEKNSEFTLNEATNERFVGWLCGDKIYQANETIEIGESNLTFSPFEMDFAMQDGAAIRLAGTVEESGIRFTSMFKEADLNTLKNKGLTVSFGTLIMPNDYLGASQAPNLEDFVAGTTVLKIKSTIEPGTDRWEVTNDGYVVYRGAMQKLKQWNYGRNFAGRGYMEITFANGEPRTIYTPFTVENNVRSVKYVANALKNDETEYEKLSDTKKAIVEGYATSEDYNVQAMSASAAMEENYAAAYVMSGRKESAV